MDYIRPLRVFSFPHVNNTLEYVRYNKANGDVGAFLTTMKFTGNVKLSDFTPKCAAMIYIGKLTKGVKRTFVPPPVKGFARQYAVVSGSVSALRGDGKKVLMEARTSTSVTSDASDFDVVFEAVSNALLVVHYHRVVPYAPVKREQPKPAVKQDEQKPKRQASHWAVKPTAVGVHVPLPKKQEAQEPAQSVPQQSLEEKAALTFGLFFSKGGGDESDAVILRKGKLFNRALNVPIEVKNTFVWAKIWDEASRRRGYFYVKDRAVKFFPIVRGRATIEDFIVNTAPGCDVALPRIELWSMRERAFVCTTRGWCWFNNERLRGEIYRRRCFSSSFSVGFLMRMGFRSLKAVRFAGTNILHIPSLNEERTFGWKSADVYLPNVPKTAIVAGDRTRLGGEILASVANALNQEEVYSSVVSSITNRLVLRDQSALLSHLDTKLCDMFSQRDAMIREKPSHRCDVFLKPQEKERLRELFPELSIQFSDSVRSSHPFANAMRSCFNGIFSRRCGGVCFFDIGGSFTYHVKAGHVNCHVCNPVLDVKDVKRRINEILFLSTAGGDSYVSSDLLTEAASKSVSYCSRESQNCDSRADAGFMVDVYDISPQQVAEAMDKKGALVFDLALMFPVELLYGNGEVYLEELDTLVKREGDYLAYNVGQCGEMYEHSFSNVSGFFTFSYVRTSSGNVFKLEYEGYRCGYHHLTMCRAQKSPGTEVTRRSLVPTFVGKSLVFIPVVAGSSVSFKTIVLDSDFVDRIYSYALNTIGTFENRTFEYAVGAVRSQKTHVITGSRVVHSKVDISPDDMWGLVVAVMAQAIKDRAKSIRSYNFIKASEGSLAGVFKLFFQTVGDCFSSVVSTYAKAMVHDNFNVLETLISMPKAFICKVPGSVVVTICTSGASDRLELRGAFDVSKETFGRKLKNSRLRVFSRAIVEDSIKVMKAMKTEDGKPLPITEDSVHAFIMGNISNVHCTRAGLLGGSKAAAVSGVSKGLVARGAATKAFSGVASFFSTGSLFYDRGLTEDERLDALVRTENAINSPVGILETSRVVVSKVVAGTKEFWSEVSLNDFTTFALRNKVLIGIFVASLGAAPIAWKYRRGIAANARRYAGSSYETLSSLSSQAAGGLRGLTSSTVSGGSLVVRRGFSSAVTVTRATVAKRQVPLALLSFSTSYAISGCSMLGIWAHALPRHLMFFFGLGTLLGARASANTWKFGGFSNNWCAVPEVVWRGKSVSSLLLPITLGVSLIIRGLLNDTIPQLAYVPPVEGRNVYDETLRYYRDFDYDEGAGPSGTQHEAVPGDDSDGSTSSVSSYDGVTNVRDVRISTNGEVTGEEETHSPRSVQYTYVEEEVAPSAAVAERQGDPSGSGTADAMAFVESVKKGVDDVFHQQSSGETAREVEVDDKGLLPESDIGDAPIQERGRAVDDNTAQAAADEGHREPVQSSPESVPPAAVPKVAKSEIPAQKEVKLEVPPTTVPSATPLVEEKPAPSVTTRGVKIIDKGKAIAYVAEKKQVKAEPPRQRNLTINEGKAGKQLCMFRTCSCGVQLDVYNEATIATRFSNAFTFVDNLKGRSAVFFSKLGEGYTYNGGSHVSSGWPRVLEDILTAIKYPSVFDHCLVQKYKMGGGVPFHADDEECYPSDNPILTVNLVGKANFSIKCRKGGKVMVINVASGDYFLMPCGFQRTHLHSVNSIDEGRISLTFRATRRVFGVGRMLQLAGGVSDEKSPGVPNQQPQSQGATRTITPKSGGKALSEGSGREVKGRSTYSIWCEQDYVKKCEWLRADNPVMALKPDYTPMTFEVVKTGTSEDAVVEYLKYLAIGIERTYRALLMARNIAVTTAEGVLKVPNQVYESLPGFHVYKSGTDLIFHSTQDGLRVRDLPYVFIAEKGIFTKGKDVDAVVALGDNLFVCDDILVFHDAINLIGALKVARCGMVGESFKSFEYKCYNAPPGGGKTTMLVDEFVKSPNSTATITANVGSSEDINMAVKKRDPNLEGLNSATTVNSRVVNFIVRGMYKRVLVDEVYMMHQGLLQLGVFATGASEGLFFGDINQIPFINREKVFRMDCAVFVPKKESVVYTSKSYRCPLDVCYLLSSMTVRGTEKCYPEKVVSGKDKPVVRSLSKRPIGTTDDVAEINADVYLCMTQLEKSDMKRSLKGKGKETPVMTVHEAQGKTFSDVVLFRTKKADDSLFTKQPHILVGLSRHTRSLVYAALSSKLDDKVGTYISDASPQSVSDALLHTFAPAGCFRGI
uniref:Methyltransferase/helicase n=1 Tax=Grapevine leafroll-associated virus 3 TaxID=55951 RepID=A0A345T7Q6_9CLOS|nr:methyltransferase/helicase [Grapevine leafroll-associated virus 3]